MVETTEDKQANEAQPSKKVAVRYGRLGFIGEFDYKKPEELRPNQPVLVETARGLELGRVVCYCGSEKPCFSVSRSSISKYVEQSGEEYLRAKAGRIVRTASTQDVREQEHIDSDAKQKIRFCQEMAERFRLRMKIVGVEHLFGGERIIFYFLAESRVDFRELVRELAREYQTRIELRQIGARDEARLLADYEICGRECCCRNFLKMLRPVNMKMAKLQKATLDPTKVSGRCGRLRCCLAYEHQSYEELARRLPKVGSWVETPQGTGRVVDRQVLTQLVQINIEGKWVVVPFEEISSGKAPKPQPQPDRESEAPEQPKQEEAAQSEVQPTSPEASSEGEQGEKASGKPRRRRGRRPRRKRKQ